ncbi:MAG: type II secretion system protein [Desulfobulbaceae bacterium]|nr:type II secretion system protein [Desulfobulbaceae bacterium]
MVGVYCGRRGAARGFTLLEILVAVAILGLAYLVVLQNFSQSFHNLERVERGWQRDFTAILTRELDFMVIPTKKADVEPLVGDIYVKGQFFQLVVVKSQDAARQTTVLLEKQP